MIVDVHTRCWDSPDQLGPAMAARIRRALDGPWQLPDASLQAHAEAMEPVAYAFVLGSVSPLTGAAIGLDEVSRVVRANPAKNLGFPSVDPTARGALDTLEKVREAGMTGITVSPTNQGFHPADSRAMRLYRRCVERNVPVVFDLSCDVAPAVMEFAQPFLIDQVLREYPDLRIVIGAMGLPFVHQTLVLIDKHEHAYADVSELTQRPRDLYQALASAHQTGAIAKLMLGSGFPLTTPEKAIVTLYSLNTLILGTNMPSIPREQLRSIVERDALTALGIQRPAGGARPGASPIKATWEVEHIKEATGA